MTRILCFFGALLLAAVCAAAPSMRPPGELAVVDSTGRIVGQLVDAKVYRATWEVRAALAVGGRPAMVRLKLEPELAAGATSTGSWKPVLSMSADCSGPYYVDPVVDGTFGAWPGLDPLFFDGAYLYRAVDPELVTVEVSSYSLYDGTCAQITTNRVGERYLLELITDEPFVPPFYVEQRHLMEIYQDGFDFE